MTSIVVDIFTSGALLLVSVFEALLKCPLGQLVLGIFWPLVDPTLSGTYYVLKYVIGPGLRLLLPRSLRFALRSCLIALSHVLNVPLLLRPLREIITVITVEAMGARYGSEARQDFEIALRLGEGKHRQLAVHFGSGDRHDLSNRFFPRALSTGPERGPFYDKHRTHVTLRHLHIAESLLLMSVISYRCDETIRACMAAGMFPQVKYFSVHSDDETDLSIFVAQDWAVLCFRGTETETLRDLLTSALVEETIQFSGHARVRRRYYQAMRSVMGDGRSRRYPVQPPVVLPGRLDATALDLVKAMDKEDKKIYITGHSMGGGLAILLGAYLVEEYKIEPAAVVTFGAPPVAANRPFVDWYHRHIHSSWRFVNGNEFSVMAPPLPFTSDVRLEHVDFDMIDPQNIQSRAIQPTYEEYEQLLDFLAGSMGLVSTFFDHNPVLTLRHLRLAASRAEQAMTAQLEPTR